MSESSIVSWSPDFCLGLSEIDHQHEALFRMINDLWQGTLRGDKSATIAKTLTELEDYTITHFREEENLMRACGYPSLAAHKAEHELFIGKLAEEKAKFTASTRMSSDLLIFLNNWLIKHIRNSDTRYADFYRASKPAEGILSRLFRKFF